ncbi:MAG: hypothetical protein CMP23_16665 [Rickettsiales bacterium]|nr:hypothetical protein [Rickettsiales bacterium]|tara:strand:- start:537 stop:1262 length:726 start_codon:yes stop_codon:yes gene_type:complete
MALWRLPLLLLCLLGLTLAGCSPAGDDDSAPGDDDDSVADDDDSADDDDTGSNDDDSASGDDDDSAPGDDDDSASGDDDDSASGDDDDSAPGDDDDDSAAGDDDDSAAPGCFLSTPASFVSVAKGQCGMTPSGPSFCYWPLDFDTATFTWSYSDVVELGSYSCSGALVSASGASGNSYSGSWDAAAGLLAWEGQDYRLISPSARPDFYLDDVNPSSSSVGDPVSPRDYLQKVSGWYFGHAT